MVPTRFVGGPGPSRSVGKETNMAGGTVTFQAQNPARSGDKSTYIGFDAKGHKVQKQAGWANCTAFVAAMGAEFDSGVRITGTQVRKESTEPVPDSNSPGLNLSQVKAVLAKHGVRMDVRCPIDFDHLDELRRDGHAIALQVDYSPFLGQPFAGSKDFDDGHIVLWLPNDNVFDPLDDGRFKGIAKAPVRIPRATLRKAAGMLETDAKTHATVGLGRAYAGVFHQKHPSGVVPQTTPAKGFEGPAATDFRVVVDVAFVRSSARGVPGKANVVGRMRRGDMVNVFATTRLGQSVGGSRVWHQVDRRATRFMHSSVIDPIG